MKINPKVVGRIAAWFFGIALVVTAATFISIQEVRDVESVIKNNHDHLDRIEQRLIELQKSLDRIEAELKEIIVMRGTASWYGPGFHGRVTASGSVYDQNAFTLAHRQLPLGSWVAIKNEDNGRVAFGIITDRGPYVKGRDFDVSLALAKQLGFERKGLTQVTVRVLKAT